MALPKQVERDVAELEAYEKQLAAEQAAAAEPETTLPVEPVAAEVTPIAEPQQTEPKPDTTDWAQKYRTLQGMFDSQVPQLHKQNKELTAQLGAMQDQILALQDKPAVVEQPDALVTAQDEEAYGADLVDLQRRVAREVMREHVTPLQKELQKRDTEIAELKAAVRKTDGAVNTMSFEQRLAIAIPGFEQTNADPKWIAFLDEIDPYTGEARRGYAEYVYNNGDIEKLKGIVKYYESATGQVDQNAERQQRQAELERQVTPTRTRAASTPTQPANTRIYTEAEMVKQFDKVRLLNVANKYDEATKLEAELSEAYMQGRVRG